MTFDLAAHSSSDLRRRNVTASPELSDHAETFARAALDHVAREYPHVQVHAMTGPEPPFVPSERHPIFFGSYDWHSCVHGHWLLARLLRLYPKAPSAPAIRAHFDQAITGAKVAGEVAYFDRPEARGFERPYGWAWLLMLAAELRRHPTGWGRTLEPLERVIVDRFHDLLPRADYPLRAGVHTNTAFALLMADVYAEAVDDRSLAALLRAKAEQWYGADVDCQAWEPSGDEFLSSALMEAAAMRRLGSKFEPWFEGFLPRLRQSEPASLFIPATVSDRSDGKIAHLDGLNLPRAWCWRLLASGLPERDEGRAVMVDAAERHLAASLPPRHGRLYGRALAGELRALGAGSLRLPAPD